MGTPGDGQRGAGHGDQVQRERPPLLLVAWEVQQQRQAAVDGWSTAVGSFNVVKDAISWPRDNTMGEEEPFLPEVAPPGPRQVNACFTLRR
jgi:hypothetical protein